MVISNNFIFQWGLTLMPVNGTTCSIALPHAIIYGLNGLCTPYTMDIPDIVIVAYFTGFTPTTINITYDYETGHKYAGEGQNHVEWLTCALV